VNFKVCGELPRGLSHQKRKKFLSDGKYYVWEEPLLYKLYGDGVYRQCLPEDEVQKASYTIAMLLHGGHFGVDKIVVKVLQVGFY